MTRTAGSYARSRSYWSDTSVLVPVYQEGARVGAVLNVLRQIPDIARIVVVDDGSTDDTVAQVQPLLRAGDILLTLPTNRGKTAALVHGLRVVTSRWVVLLDADLQGLQTSHLDQLCRPVWIGSARMSVAILAERYRWLRQFRYWNGLLSGQRCLTRDDAWSTLSSAVTARYGAEILLSLHARRAGWPTTQLLWKGVQHPRKTQKYGLILGSWRYLTSLADFAQVWWQNRD